MIWQSVEVNLFTYNIPRVFQSWSKAATSVYMTLC